ncbi:MAG: efflux RND transporter periplasmic adaptor subunit [Acidobacteria bacterium]|nr:efflux RND transporter periplasmic adaptor subunit [Acidobacteriota bacterium]
MVFSKKILTIGLIVILAAVLVYFFVIKKGAKTGSEATEAEAAEAKQKLSETPLLVSVVLAVRMDLIMKLRSPGEAVTDRRIVMKTEVKGVLKNLNVEESQHVKKGDVLLEIDDAEYRLDVEKLEAERLKVLSELLLEKKFETAGTADSRSSSERTAAKEAFEEAQARFQKGSITDEEFSRISRAYEGMLIESGAKKDEIMAATKRLTQAEIDLQKSRLQLDRTIIRAPFDGIVTAITISSREHLSAGQELFTLVNISRIQVHAKVLESEIRKMKVGREVDLKFSAYPEKVFKGRVKAISPLVDPAKRTCDVIIDVGNSEEEIKPGMHAEVEIAADIYKDRLLIPQDAVLSRSGRKLAFVFDNGVAKWRYLEIGLENEDYAEVLDGVTEGEQVLIDGHFTLAHDAKVRIEE